MTTPKKPYRPTSLPAAIRRIRQQEGIIAELRAEKFGLTMRCQARAEECRSLARLAAKGPAFNGPMEAWNAEMIRNNYLREMGMNPDGTMIVGKVSPK